MTTTANTTQTSKAKARRSLSLTPSAMMIKASTMICKQSQTWKTRNNKLRRFPSLRTIPEKTASKNRTSRTQKWKTHTRRRFPNLRETPKEATTTKRRAMTNPNP